MRKASIALFSLASLVMVAGCAMQPVGPTVRVMPGPYKPFEVFQRDQYDCAQYADQQVAGQRRDRRRTRRYRGRGCRWCHRRHYRGRHVGPRELQFAKALRQCICGVHVRQRQSGPGLRAAAGLSAAPAAGTGSTSASAAPRIRSKASCLWSVGRSDRSPSRR